MGKIIPISLPDHYRRIGTRFIINDIMCVGYSIVNDYTISVLFALHQDLFDKYSYINMNVELKSPGELEHFRASGMYIKDIQADKENNLRLQEITKFMTSSNLYTTDFNFDSDESNHFYILRSIRNTGKDSGEILEYQIGNSEYIQFMLFNQFISCSMMNSSMFLDESLKNLTFIKANHVKLDGSTTMEIGSKNPRLKDRKLYKVVSHYTFQCGPTFVRANYAFTLPKKPSKILREPLTCNQYEAEFNEDLYVTCSIPEVNKDQLLVVIVNHKEKHTTVIRLEKELYELTNLKDPENYVFYSIDSAETSISTEPPIVKFPKNR